MSGVYREYMTQIMGNRALCRRLALDAASGSMPHAFILEGASGTGKKLIALNTAAALACTNKEKDSLPIPCLKCEGCRKVLEGLSPDVIFVNKGDKATIGVDEARFVREDVKVIPNDLEYKIYIIEEADKLTEQAQNALLLTLEEPPSYAVFILLCEVSGALLETIRSRAPIFRTELMSAEDIERCILEQSDKARLIKSQDSSLFAQISVSAGGAVGKALEYLDEQSFEPIKEARALTYAFLELMASGADSSKAILLLSRFSVKREALGLQLETLMGAATELLILKKSDARKLTFFESEEKALELCELISATKLFKLCEALNQAITENKQNANVKLLLMNMLINAKIL